MRASQARELVRTLQIRTENKTLQDILSEVAREADVGKEEIKWGPSSMPDFVKKELQELGYKVSMSSTRIYTITWKE